MTQEHRVILAALLSSIIMVWYLHVFGKPSAAPQGIHAPVQQQTQKALEPPDRNAERIKLHLTQKEEAIYLESDQLRLEIGKTSASVRTVELKRFNHLSTNQILHFGETYPVIMFDVGELYTTWNLVRSSRSEALWDRQVNGISQELKLSLSPGAPTFSVEASANGQLPVTLVASFGRSDNLNGRSNPLEAIFLTEKDRAWKRTYLRYVGLRSLVNVPRGTLMATLAERYFCLSIQPEAGPAMASAFSSAPETLSYSISGPEETLRATVYIGPRDFFSLRDAGFEKAFQVGFFTNIGLIFMLFLKFLASITRSYGIAVILFAILITAALSPFTLISFRSMKKMQTLQPKLEHLKKKHAGDPKRVNQETFALFKEHRVSPLSGCLPLVIQIPIFFSIWSAISHIIEIRGQPFLWIKDLSMPDRLARIPPGLDLNVLPILMAAAMFMQTKFSQQNIQSSGTNEMAKMMSGPLMPIMFGVMFYSLPSCLVLYWLTNSLTTMAFYKMAKQ